ncbi:MAG: glycosyl transferase family 2 [Ilumatobacteraceae bacterium]|nr:glycosyl transferase family 2 [Ilumatobacteraceae bacterium]
MTDQTSPTHSTPTHSTPTHSTPTPGPSVSVVIATRDRPELLRVAIAAILEQEYDGPIDIAVVFDQTEPDTSLNRSDDLRTVAVMPNSRMQGLPGGRNTGISATTGSLIAFCDDDDQWLPGKLAQQVAHMQRHPDVTMCTTGLVIDFDGVRTDRPSPVPELTVPILLHDRVTEAHPSTFLFRREVVARIGMVDEQIPGGYSEDYDFLIRVARDGKIACLAAPLVSVKWGRTSYFTTRWLTIIEAQRYLLAKHPEFAHDRRGEARIRGQIAFALAAVGKRRETLGEIGRVLRRWPLEKRWPVAVLVALHIISAERVLAWAHKTGRGI